MSTRYKQSTGVAPICQWDGVYAAKVIVTSGVAVKLRIPQVLGAAESNWAVPLNPGVGITPNAGAPVFAMFLGGDVTVPVYIVPGNNVTNAVIKGVVTSQIDTNTADLKAIGVATAGGTGKPADAGHIHPGAGSVGSFKAFQPGTTTTETWHTLPLSNGFTAVVGGGFLPPRYRLNADGNLSLCGGMVLSATGYTGVIFGTVPSGYYRTDGNQQNVPVSFLGPSTTMTGTPRVSLDGTTGGIVITGNPGGQNGKNVDITCTLILT